MDSNPESNQTDPSSPGAAPADTPVCRRLRTKMYYVLGREHVNLRESSPTAQYWCSLTATVIGPDDETCSPETCQPDRACFETE